MDASSPPASNALDDSARRPVRSGGLRRSLLMATGAFLIYGVWAAWANSAHGHAASLRAGLTQGFVSFSSTFFLTWAMELIHARFRSPLVAFAAAVIGATLLGAALSVILHLAMGTPEIATTIAPSLLAGLGYSLLYCAGLSRAAMRAARP